MQHCYLIQLGAKLKIGFLAKARQPNCLTAVLPPGQEDNCLIIEIPNGAHSFAKLVCSLPPFRQEWT